ncbi:MAG: alanine racemase [Alphaproteobacteria bacterium]|nr:alanine racemase [Alphaproteobacteria bacterium]
MDQGSNLPLAAVDESVETPAVVIDKPRLQANIDAMQARAAHHGVTLRPHIKTHKCLEIAAAQLGAGAVGLTCSKTEEAAVFAAAGVPSITVAYPQVLGAKVDRLIAVAAEHGTSLRFIADSAAGVETLVGAAKRAARTIPVFVKVDVGLHRCGVQENDPALVTLAQAIARAPGLVFAGLLAHAGHAYGGGNAAGVRQVAREENATMDRARRRIVDAGIAVPEISVGSTPTALASDAYEGVTEMRPGNYVFLDLTPVQLGLATLDQVALTVLATVVSANDQYLIVDSGSKVLSSDFRPHGGGGTAYGLAFPDGPTLSLEDGLPVAKLSEEHGWIAHGGHRLPVGARVRIVPNHSCPVANLADAFVVAAPGESPTTWRVAARGKVH